MFSWIRNRNTEQCGRLSEPNGKTGPPPNSTAPNLVPFLIKQKRLPMASLADLSLQVTLYSCESGRVLLQDPVQTL